MNRLLKITENEFKEEFIKYFGEEKWNQEMKDYIHYMMLSMK